MRERIAALALVIFMIATPVGSFLQWGLGAGMIALGFAALMVSYFLGNEA